MTNQRLYRIRSGRSWYRGRSGWCRDEHDSPIFTNRLSAERTMKRELRTNRELSETRPDLPWEVQDMLTSAAEIVEYELVPVR